VHFAGVYPTYYWQNTSWNIVVYDPLTSNRFPEKPRFDYYRHMADFFRRYNFNDFFLLNQRSPPTAGLGPITWRRVPMFFPTGKTGISTCCRKKRNLPQPLRRRERKKDDGFLLQSFHRRMAGKRRECLDGMEGIGIAMA
jgi:hypothetical protein